MRKINFEYEKLNQCPYCHSDKIFLFLKAPDRLTNVPGEFYLSECKSCGLIFQNPRVKKEYIKFFYENPLGYYKPRVVSETDFSYFKRVGRKLKKYALSQTLINYFNYKNLGHKNVIFKLITQPFKRILKIRLTPDYIKNGKLLEIGCSYGEKLEKLKSLGWEVKGIEMNEKAAAHARDIKKLDVENNFIEDVDFPPENFDVILLSMVLEHLYTPFETLKKITQWLKPNGQLIFSIPYIRGFEGEIFKSHYYGLQLPYHITFFNKKVLIEYLSMLGYKEIKFYHDFFDRDIVASAYYKYLDNNKLLWKIISKNKFIRFFLIKPFVFILSLFGQTSRITVFAVKDKVL